MSKHVMLVVVHVSLCAFAVSQPNLPNKEGLGKRGFRTSMRGSRMMMIPLIIRRMRGGRQTHVEIARCLAVICVVRAVAIQIRARE